MNSTLIAALAMIFVVIALPTYAAEQWGVEEIVLHGPEGGNPYLDVKLEARFQQGSHVVKVPGFWDGDGVYRIRFSPPTPGTWRYETESSTRDLNGKTGAFKVTRPTHGNHGPVQVSDTYYFRYADGAPYHEFGTTCYAWTHQTPELQKQTLKTLATAPFNKIRFCVFPKSYAYNQNEPEFFAFKKGADGKFDFSLPDPTFWRHFEQRILDLQRLGIQADLILWHPYDRWGFSNMGKEADDRYLRYCIARLSAYRNVWWSLANEYDFMGSKHMDDWERFFSILQKEDPSQRLRSIHNGAKLYDYGQLPITHAGIQTSDMNGGVRFRAQFHKPVIYDECMYEGNIPEGWGTLTPKLMTQRFWLGTMSGCYVGHGETYLDPQDILWWSKGGVLHGQSPKRIQWLKDFLTKAPPFYKLQPLGDDQGHFILGDPGRYYLLYCFNGHSESIHLEGNTPYKVDIIDPWEMTLRPAGTAQPGEFTTTPETNDVVYRFMIPDKARSPKPTAK
ncbi:MAG: DUF5060 domain-containing protein [Capsulimonas sp.]|uniref:DUF5060 domain-containing protein n=1 Tax=Capsulimonas sp. TaxID=2494211 RepID=UPI003262E0CF